MNKNSVIVIRTTVATHDQARQLAGRLVDSKLAACVQIDGPVESIYRWQGAVETSTEWRLSIKTAQAMASSVEDLMTQQHPYDVPQFIAEPALTNDAYGKWLHEQLD